MNPLGEAVPGDRPQLLPAPTAPLLGVPQLATPALSAGPYVFPVYGRASVNDAFGSLAPGVDYAHGDEIATTLGEPVLAAAAGTLYGVGWSRVGGNRLWLRDGQGNEFYYGQLSAFSSLAANGAHVRAGQVIGFAGDTGESQGGPALEFQLRPGLAALPRTAGERRPDDLPRRLAAGREPVARARALLGAERPRNDARAGPRCGARRALPRSRRRRDSTRRVCAGSWVVLTVASRGRSNRSRCGRPLHRRRGRG